MPLINFVEEDEQVVRVSVKVNDGDVYAKLHSEAFRNDALERIGIARDAFALAARYEAGKATRGETLEGLRRLATDAARVAEGG